MNIGIFTYGTRGDLQPYIGLALGLMERGHTVTIAATEDFKNLVESFGVSFQPLFGNTEQKMNETEGQRVLKSENPVQLIKYYFKVIHDYRHPLRKSYEEAMTKVDYIIANTMTLPITCTIAEKQRKKIALTYFMPPPVPTKEFPLAELDIFNFPWYNKLTYKFIHAGFWQLVKKDTNEYRRELGLPELKENIILALEKQNLLNLYCISPSLFPQPKDWKSNHKITGVVNIPVEYRKVNPADAVSEELAGWLAAGDKPVYIGFGSNGIGNQEKYRDIITEVLNRTGERILFCTGWSVFDTLPSHTNLFVAKYVNHETIFPLCKAGIFHGGAGTLATMLRNNLPPIVVSFYTDQPAWGKIVERKKLGVHIPAKKVTADKLINAIAKVQEKEIRDNVASTGQKIANENGLRTTLDAIEKYFSQTRLFVFVAIGAALIMAGTIILIVRSSNPRDEPGVFMQALLYCPPLRKMDIKSFDTEEMTTQPAPPSLTIACGYTHFAISYLAIQSGA